MDGESVSHREHTVTKGERYEMKKPIDSDLLHGDGSFIAETEKNAQYTQKKGERYETVRPEVSEIWKVCCVFVNENYILASKILMLQESLCKRYALASCCCTDTYANAIQ